jgi:uncharacterized protein YvpB
MPDNACAMLARRLGFGLLLLLVTVGCGSPAALAPTAIAAPPTLVPTLVPTSTPEPTPRPTAAAVVPLASAPTLAPSPTAVPPPASRLLEVPLHRQEHALSCEAAALQMALGALGRPVAEADLLADLARDPTPRTVKPDGHVVWGDPDVGFVGRVDGVFGRDGYGVYQGPIAALAREAGFAGSTPLSEADPRELYDAVRDGFPVVVWMPYAGQIKGRGAWTTPAGKQIDYVVTEHAVVLAGVADDGVSYADPYTASLEHMSFSTFEAANAELGGRAVIVRP